MSSKFNCSVCLEIRSWEEGWEGGIGGHKCYLELGGDGNWMED